MRTARFEPVEDTGSTASLRGLCVVDRDVVWASGTNGAVLRSVDGGASWTNVHPESEMDFRDVESFDADVAFVMSITKPAAILRTFDGGATWDEVYRSPNPDAFFDSLAFFDRERGCVFGDPMDGAFVVLRTADGGDTWQRVPAADLPTPCEGEAAFAASGTCIATVGAAHAWIGTGGLASRVLVSGDGGATWSAAATPMQVPAPASGPTEPDTAPSPTQGIYSVAFRDERHGVVVGGDFTRPEVGDRNAAITRDGGRTWVSAVERPHGYRSAVAWVPDRENTLVAVGRAGADYSEDGGRTWSALGKLGFYAIDFAPGVDGSHPVGWAVGANGRIARLAFR